MLFPSVGGYMIKNTEAIICFILWQLYDIVIRIDKI